MTNTVKAPDIGVVKSAAKAIRASLYETTKIPHARALEIASKAFGFSSYHACKRHFDHLAAGVFDPHEDISLDTLRAAVSEIIKDAKSSDIVFQNDEVSASFLSSLRSPEVLISILILGASRTLDLKASMGNFILRSVPRNVNTTETYVVEHISGSLWGSSDSPTTLMVCDANLYQCFKVGALAACDISYDRRVDISSLKQLAIDRCGTSCFFIPHVMKNLIGQTAQNEINNDVFEATDLEVMLRKIRYLNETKDQVIF